MRSERGDVKRLGRWRWLMNWGRGEREVERVCVCVWGGWVCVIKINWYSDDTVWKKRGEMEGDSGDLRQVTRVRWRCFSNVLFLNSFHRVIKGTGADHRLPLLWEWGWQTHNRGEESDKLRCCFFSVTGVCLICTAPLELCHRKLRSP